MKVIILLGPPGSGKGTQAGLLAEKFNLYHLETSKLIERIIKSAKKGDFIKINGKKYDLEKEKKLWREGILCSPPFVTYLIKEKIEELNKESRTRTISPGITGAVTGLLGTKGLIGIIIGIIILIIGGAVIFIKKK